MFHKLLTVNQFKYLMVVWAAISVFFCLLSRKQAWLRLVLSPRGRSLFEKLFPFQRKAYNRFLSVDWNKASRPSELWHGWKMITIVHTVTDTQSQQFQSQQAAELAAACWGSMQCWYPQGGWETPGWWFHVPHSTSALNKEPLFRKQPQIKKVVRSTWRRLVLKSGWEGL